MFLQQSGGKDKWKREEREEREEREDRQDGGENWRRKMSCGYMDELRVCHEHVSLRLRRSNNTIGRQLGMRWILLLCLQPT